MKLPKRERVIQFTLTVGVDNTITIGETPDFDSKAIGFGPGTLVGAEIIELLEDEGMI